MSSSFSLSLLLATAPPPSPPAPHRPADTSASMAPIRRCSHFIAQKNRTCHMIPPATSTLCAYHTPNAIHCPHCTTGLRDENALHHHLTRALCPQQNRLNALLDSPYYWANCNLPCATPLAPLPDVSPPVELLSGLLEMYLTRMKAQRACLVPVNTPHLPETAVIRQQWSNARDSTLKMEPRHFSQAASIAALVLCHPTPQPHRGVAVLELGAGRAYTSLFLLHLLQLRGVPCDLVVVDKATNRLKADRTIHQWLASPDYSVKSFQRLRLDIAHLFLPAVAKLAEAHDVRVVGKHVCGAALDLSLTAVTTFAKVCRPKSLVLTLASCCRRLCSFRAFGGDAAILWKYGITEKKLAVICRVAHWGLDRNAAKRDASYEQRRELGEKARLIIDCLRVAWLRDNGWDAWVTKYTEQSSEDACIHAIWTGEGMPEKEELHRSMHQSHPG